MTSIRIKPIVPKLDLPDLDRITREELRREARAVERELGFPTRRWRHKVQFRQQQNADGSITVFTDNKPYKWTDRGTKPHIIRPRKAKALRFNSQFRAKTKPDSLSSAAGKNAPPAVFAQEVKHPGTKARGFTKLVLKRSRPRFKKNIDKAIAAAVRRANRGK